MSVRDELEKILDDHKKHKLTTFGLIGCSKSEAITRIIETFAGRITGEAIIKGFHDSFAFAFCGGCRGGVDGAPCSKECENLYIASGVASAIKKELGGK